MKKVFVLGALRKSGKKSVRSRSASKKRKAIQILEGEQIFVGVDVHKSTYSVALWSDGRGVIGVWTQPSDADLLAEKLGEFADQVGEVVYEAGPTGFGLVRALRAAGFRANVIAPAETPEKKGRRSKTDPMDARKLAEYSCKKLLTTIYVPTLQEEADRQVTRMREAMKKKLSRTKNQIKSFLLYHGIPQPEGLAHWAKYAVNALHEIELKAELRFSLDTLLNDYEHQQRQLQRLDEKIAELAESDRHREQVKCMRSVGGIGLLTAMTVRTELPSPERFARREEITSAIGLVPQVRQSGEQRSEGGIEKRGNSLLRATLVESAWRWIRYDPKAREHYSRLVRNSGESKIAVVGVARKLGILLWRLETRLDVYRPAA